ncbi:MAG: hypothetical protein E3J87_07470 [Candidatus Cloacimonadota bacterium]|nr:MAG: hypothetical protein E3J87_07470 [Candidatus Cloacimonadota bacterium]
MKGTRILCLIVLAVLLPSFIYGGEVQEGNISWYYREKDPSSEIVSMRNLNTKVFLNENGHCTYRVFLQPVHYIDKAGFLCDIEPSCTPGGRSSAMDFSGYADDLFGDIVTYDHIWTHEDGFWRGFAKFNTSGIPDTTTIDSVKLTLYALNCWGVLFGGSHDIRSMESNPQFGNGWSVFADAGNGDLYVNNFNPTVGWHTWILGDDPLDPACVQMTNQLPQDWFAIGMCDYGGGGFYSNAMGYGSGMGNVDIEAPVAIALVTFTASPDFDFVRLDWRTELEVDNFEWLIERKEEGGDYEIIATTPGQGTKPGPTTYSYIDRDVSQGKGYYYRLTDISTYGHQTIHTPIFVRIPTIGEGKLLVSPTMFKKNLSIKIRGLSGNRGTLSIFDKTGRNIKTISLSGKESPLTVHWNGQDNNGRNVKSGVYFIRLDIDGTKPETKKVVFMK